MLWVASLPYDCEFLLLPMLNNLTLNFAVKRGCKSCVNVSEVRESLPSVANDLSLAKLPSCLSDMKVGRRERSTLSYRVTAVRGPSFMT